MKSAVKIVKINESKTTQKLKTPQKFKIRPLFAWYDFWIGLFYDKKKHRIYFFPIPMLGIYIDLPKKK